MCSPLGEPSPIRSQTSEHLSHLRCSENLNTSLHFILSSLVIKSLRFTVYILLQISDRSLRPVLRPTFRLALSVPVLRYESCESERTSEYMYMKAARYARKRGWLPHTPGRKRRQQQIEEEEDVGNGTWRETEKENGHQRWRNRAKCQIREMARGSALLFPR
ncbi:hypothetical protein CBL_07298 [Carabus blaptoides fortunei]